MREIREEDLSWSGPADFQDVNFDSSDEETKEIVTCLLPSSLFLITFFKTCSLVDGDNFSKINFPGCKEQEKSGDVCPVLYVPC